MKTRPKPHPLTLPVSTVESKGGQVSYIQVVVGGNARLCNHKCYFCDVKETKGFKDMGAFDVPAIKSTLFSLCEDKDIGTIVITGRGEPTLHPTFDRIISAIGIIVDMIWARHHRELRVELHTNGTRVSTLSRLPHWVHIVLSDAVHWCTTCYSGIYGVPGMSKRPWEEAAEALKRAGRKFSFNVIVLGDVLNLRNYIEDLDTKYEPVLINVRPVAGRYSNVEAQIAVDGLDDTDLPVVRRNCDKRGDNRPYIVTQDGKVYRDWDGATE